MPERMNREKALKAGVGRNIDESRVVEIEDGDGTNGVSSQGLGGTVKDGMAFGTKQDSEERGRRMSGQVLGGGSHARL